MTRAPAGFARDRAWRGIARSAFALVLVTAIAMVGVAMPDWAAAGASSSSSGQAAASGDIASPVVESFDFTPQSVDLSSGPQSVTVTVRLTDATGVRAPSVVLDSDRTTQRAGFGPMSLSSGTTTDGVWSRTITLPASGAGGAWTVLLYPVSDTLGNSDNTFHYPPTQLSVTAPASDVAAPALQDFSFSPEKVNVSSSAQTVTVSVRVRDATEVVAPYVLLDSNTTTQTLGFGQMTLTSGTTKDGTWSRTVPVPTTSAPGGWDVKLYPLEDTVGNNSSNFLNHPTKLLVSATVPTEPAAPDSPSITRGDGTVTLDWATPAEHESDITGYSLTSQSDGVTRTFTTEQTAYSSGYLNHVTLTDLTIGSTYRFTVAATNGVGTGPDSALSAPVVPTHVPGTPTGVEAIPGDHKIAASWTVPASDGEPVTGYVLTATRADGYSGVSVDVPADPHATTGSQQTGLLENDNLENGIEYTITVDAYNGAGNGTASTEVRVTPVGPPTAPGEVNAVGGDAQMTVTWAPPSSDGGSPITGYVVTATPRPEGAAPLPAAHTVDASARTLTYTGLSNGVAYDFSVQAINGLGTSPAGVRTEKPVRVPDAPTTVRVTRGDTRATVSWAPPRFDGGADILGYRITANPGGTTAWADVGDTSKVFPGLKNGTRYTFRVQAVNLPAGTGSAGVSASVVPAGRPKAPTKPGIMAGKRYATITWKAPSTNGTSITRYRVTSSTGLTKTVAGTVRRLKFTGLRKGKRLSFRVRAVNSVGYGTYSTASRVVKIR